MSDITQPAQPDELSESAVRVLQDIDRIRGEILWYKNELAKHERDLSIEQANNAALHAQLEKVERERGFYQRWTVELVTKFNTVGGILAEVMSQAKDAAYRPNGAAPQQPALPGLEEGARQAAEGQDDGRPAPAFLTRPGPRQEDGGQQ